MAKWESGIEWTVSSNHFFTEDIYKGGIGFDKVSMKLGGKQLEREHEFYSPGAKNSSLLVKSLRNGEYLLEDNQKLPPVHLGWKWNELKVPKYSHEGFGGWIKGRNTWDYDVEFDKCKFTKKQRNNEDEKAMIVTCTWRRGNNWITKYLSSEDFKY